MSDVEQQQDPKWYRDQMEALRKENKELREFKTTRTLDDAGITGAARRGVLKDIARGDFHGELTVNGLKEYAADEWEWTPPPTSESDTGQVEAPVEALHDHTNPLAGEVEDGTSRLDQLRQAGTPPEVPDLADEANRLEAEGNFAAARRAKIRSQMSG